MSTSAFIRSSASVKMDVFDEWSELADDYKQLEKQNETYLSQLAALSAVQGNCLKKIAHQRYRIGVISKYLRELERKPRNNNEHLEKVEKLKNDILKREVDLQHIESTLPRTGGKYLRVVLGNIDVSFLNKDAKIKYKDEYEKFKLISHIICFVVVLINLQVHFRPLELAYFFFLVWYYCTLTIRESILKVNGSRIKGWWRIHHVISIVTSGILLIWPDNTIWHEFRYQFFLYTIYSCIVQYLQFKYQSGQLYRLKALGKRKDMDITIEGFHSWMWRGLSFLLPFLFVVYIVQFINAVTLFRLCLYHPYTWHVPALIVLFVVLCVGNTATTIMVVPDKLKKKMIDQYRLRINFPSIPSVSNFNGTKK